MFTYFLNTFLPSFPTSPCLASGLRETINTFGRASKVIEIPAVLGDASMSDLPWDATSLVESRTVFHLFLIFLLTFVLSLKSVYQEKYIALCGYTPPVLLFPRTEIDTTLTTLP